MSSITGNPPIVSPFLRYQVSDSSGCEVRLTITLANDRSLQATVSRPHAETAFGVGTDDSYFPAANVSAPSATKGVKELESQLPKQENPLKTEANKAGLMAPGKQVRLLIGDVPLLSFTVDCVQGTTANPNMPSEPRERK